MRFKRILLIILSGIITNLYAVSAQAIPTLQLDIGGGTYDFTTETIVSSGEVFTLYAFLIPNSYNQLSDTYYISAVVSPMIGEPGANLGSFSFNGDVIDVTAEMTYGIAPLEGIISSQGWDKGDLPKHGMFPTYFSEFGFSFSAGNQINKYNTQDRAISDSPIDLDYESSGGMYYTAFSIDTSLLDPNYIIHFDLYNTKLITGTGDIDITQFAPFSHDAESCHNCASVPEASTVLLLGAGFAGLWIFKRLIMVIT
jgi:hypothetical protein